MPNLNGGSSPSTSRKSSRKAYNDDAPLKDEAELNSSLAFVNGGVDGTRTQFTPF
jgi:hypothetical protein